MKSGLGDRNNSRMAYDPWGEVPAISMKSGLGDRNNITTGDAMDVGVEVSMKSGLGDRNNWFGNPNVPAVSLASQ